MKSKKLLVLGLIIGAVGIAALLVGSIFFGNFTSRFGDRYAGSRGGYGTMGSGGMGYGMMGNGGMGMMGGYGGPGDMMGGGPADVGTAPFTLDQATEAALRYLDYLGNSDLKVKEVLEFSNGFYVQVEEQSNLAGSLELTVERNTGIVSPLGGPNLAWNTKYGVSAYDGMMGRGGFGSGGMMGRGYGSRPSGASATTEMPLNQQDASELAQEFLDRQLPGTTAGDVDTFYGYHTVKVNQGDRPFGLLAVNGYYGQIWYYSWTGAYLNGKKL